MKKILAIFLFIQIFLSFTSSFQPSGIELVPKMIRRPSHLDHYLCKKIHNGLGIRSVAVTNLSGDVCRTYCRVIDRMGGRIFYTENMSPNFVRCGPYQARCVDGSCVGFNYPYAGLVNNVPIVQPTSIPSNQIESMDENENAMDTANLSNQDGIKLTSTPRTSDFIVGKG